MDIPAKKGELRRTIRKQLLSLTESEKKQASQKIFKAIGILESFRKAKSIMLYASTEGEVNTFPIMEDVLGRGLTLWLPFCDTETKTCFPAKVKNLKEDLSQGAFGIWEPPAPQERKMPKDFKPSIIFVPGMAFDKKGRRLGRGLGYYDRFLSGLPQGITKIGLAFNSQILAEVPVDSSDILMDRVISR